MPDLEPTTLPPTTAADPLASLKKMSTTAGVGIGEYVAINPLAITAVLLGMASLLVFLHDILLLVPAAGVVCGLIALRQIRGSNGTQTGSGLAVAGLVLCTLIGGGALGRRAVEAWRLRGDERQIDELVRSLGQDLKAGSYDAAYQRFGPRFQSRVGRREFEERWKLFVAHHLSGGLRSMEWNRHLLRVEDAPPDAPAFWGMAFVQFDKPLDPVPQYSVLVAKTGGAWQIEDVPATFPAPPKTSRKNRPGT